MDVGYPIQHPTGKDLRRVGQARTVRALAGISQVLVLVALYVLWKHLQVPFWTAVEWCFVVGVLVYTILMIVAAILLALARMQPTAFVVAHLGRLATVGVYAALRYVHGLGFVQSAATLAVLYVVAGLLVRRIERRARRRWLAG
jgi:hypothetical protein